MSELARLSAELEENVAQLAQLDELLAADPTNEEFASIRADLQQVINTTIELQAQSGTGADGADGATQSTAPPQAAASSYSAAASSSSAAAAPSAAASASSASAATPYVSQRGADGNFAPGSRVLAVYGKQHGPGKDGGKDGQGKSYIARVDAVDEGAETYAVSYLEYGGQATVPFEHVSVWRSASAEQLKGNNVPVKALWPEDGLFYPASLEGPSPGLPGHFIVRFGAAVGVLGKRKKKVDVPLQDLQINEKFMDPNGQLTAAASASAKAAAAPLTEELPVPPHLEVQPTDSDAVRQGKVKKLKKLRFEHKKLYEEQQSSARQTNWKDFVAGKGAAGGVSKKKAKLSHAPGLAQLQKTVQKKGSMFASPDSLEGVVGVIGSGRGMTHIQEIKRHVFETSDATM